MPPSSPMCWTKGKSTGGFWIVVWVVFVLVAAVWFSIKFWCWLGAGESGSTTIRNIALVIAALIGLPIAIWRSMVAERQATASQSQAEIAERGLLNERYQKGAEMLGSDVLSVRLGGIYALRQLAEEHPKDYHLQIMRLHSCVIRLRRKILPTGARRRSCCHGGDRHQQQSTNRYRTTGKLCPESVRCRSSKSISL